MRIEFLWEIFYSGKKLVLLLKLKNVMVKWLGNIFLWIYILNGIGVVCGNLVV